MIGKYYKHKLPYKEILDRLKKRNLLVYDVGKSVFDNLIHITLTSDGYKHY